MPPIRSVSSVDNIITIVDHRGGPITLRASDIPASQNTIAKIESYINLTWIPANIVGYKMQVHVINRSPLRIVVWTGNLDVAIPANWWLD